MRIIYYSPHPTHDIVSEVGYSTHQREVINALRALGHEVITVIMGGENVNDHRLILEQKINPSQVKLLLKRIIPRFIWTTLNNYKLILHDKTAEKRLEEAINIHKPDLIYERSEYLQDSGARMAKKYGVKYFLEVNAPFVEEMHHFEGYSLYEGRAHKVERLKLDTAKRVFSVSSALTDFLCKRYQCDPVKIVLQPNCINPDQQQYTATQGIREKLNFGNYRVIGFVGSIFPYHGVDILISAFAKVHKENAGTRLLIVGDGTIMPQLKKLAADLGVAEQVVFAGKIPHKEVFSYIQVMDICVMAKSNWYGSPVKIFEYGLMNKPVIAPDTSPVRDVMVHNESGLLVGNDEEQLADSIMAYLNNPELATACAENFHKRVITEFTWKKAAERIIQECA